MIVLTVLIWICQKKIEMFVFGLLIVSATVSLPVLKCKIIMICLFLGLLFSFLNIVLKKNKNSELFLFCFR
jgi:hypothetical protein